MLSNHLILCLPFSTCPLYLPSIFPGITVFSNESALRIRQPKYWNFNFSISLSKSYNQPKLPLTSILFSWCFPWGTCRNHLPLSSSASFLQTDNPLSFYGAEFPSLPCSPVSSPLKSIQITSLCGIIRMICWFKTVAYVCESAVVYNRPSHILLFEAVKGWCPDLPCECRWISH